MYELCMSLFYYLSKRCWGFPGRSAVKKLLAGTGDAGLTPGLGKSRGEGNMNPLQYSCLGNPMDRGAWQTTVHGVVKSQTRLSDLTFNSYGCVFAKTKKNVWKNLDGYKS